MSIQPTISANSGIRPACLTIRTITKPRIHFIVRPLVWCIARLRTRFMTLRQATRFANLQTRSITRWQSSFILHQTASIARRRTRLITLSASLFLTVSMFLLAIPVFAQQPPPRPIAVFVNPTQGMIFGAFYQGVVGGTVILSPSGSRSSTGDLVLANLGVPFSPAIFQIDANAGTVISIMNGPDITLTGSNGGTLHLHLGPSSTGTPFTTTAVPPARTQLMIGGTLTAGSPLANPSGSYSGVFSVTFIQQ